MDATVLSRERRFSPKILARIEETVRNKPELSMRKLSQQVCQWIDWRKRDGGLADVSCRLTLRKLESKGAVKLPGGRSIVGKRNRYSPRPTKRHTVSLIGSVESIQELSLIPVDSRNKELSKLWNNLIETYHYLRSSKLCGSQQRYLIGSEHGWLGALSFSASAWSLKARDSYIGWNKVARCANLPLVVNNSRLLILPSVRVKNLASKVLSICADRLPDDWHERYGYRPVLLETFVERRRFTGTCYRAANWVLVGSTKGRGRQDQHNEHLLPIKDIYLYPLRADFKEILTKVSLERNASEISEKKTTAEIFAPSDWAEEEFCRSDFGDRRLNNRLLRLARDFYNYPQANIPQACGERAKTKAAYRFFDNQKVKMDKILASHYESTAERAKKEKVVLSIQDTTSLNYSTHPATERLGLIGSSENKPIGLLVHDTLAVRPDGVPLGLLDVQVWSRDPKKYGKKHLRYELPIEQKESMKWLRSFKAASTIQKHCPDTLFVSVGDREADIYELFVLAQENPSGPKLLVRADRERLNKDGQPVWDYVENQPIAGKLEVQVPRRPAKKARVANLDIRYSEVELRPPKRKKKMGSLKVWAVLANEGNTPEGVDPIRWMLLTTLEVTSFEEAIEKIKWYSKRWQIEVYHRTLKSGCKIEERQLGHADRIEGCLAIDMVVAWRILHLAHLGRETPNVPCTVYFEDYQWKALHCFVNRTREEPKIPPCLSDAMRMVAGLGGFLGRKSDGNPGTKTLWLGIQRLDDIAAAWQIFYTPTGPP